MTCMPASRSARATTLIPRSCPSSPTLANTMRSGRSMHGSLDNESLPVVLSSEEVVSGARPARAKRTARLWERLVDVYNATKEENAMLQPLREIKKMSRFFVTFEVANNDDLAAARRGDLA